MRRLLSLLFLMLANGCVEQTGSGLVQFEAYAGGPVDAAAGAPYEFDNRLGFHVTLTRARLRVGAIYLNRARPILGAQDTACILPGLYAAEVRSAATIDALSPELVPFERPGSATADRALTGEVWLTGGDIDADNDSTRILDYAGLATRGEATYGFHGVVTIGSNRAIVSADPATPGANPLCKQRIVTPIPVDITPQQDGELILRVNPEVWFDSMDFSRIPNAVGSGEDSRIADSNTDAASNTLFQGLRSTDAYRFDWSDAL